MMKIRQINQMFEKRGKNAFASKMFLQLKNSYYESFFV